MVRQAHHERLSEQHWDLAAVTRVSDNKVLWQANTVSASGKTLTETLGNGLTTTRAYDAVDRITSIYTPVVHAQNYTYDALGNITQRTDGVPNVIENFTYDTLNRLLQVTGTAGPSNTALIPRTFVYNAIGNILYKSDAGLFTYSASGAGSVRPHAVASVAGPINASYTYDANGSMTAGNGKTLTYTSFNMVKTIVSGAYNYTYNYDAEHQRVKLITVRPDDTLTSIYASAGFYEKEISTNTGEVTHKFYVKGVGVHVAKSTGLSEMRYYHTDNLGSIAWRAMRRSPPSASRR